MVRRKPYPHNTDILNAIMRVLSREPLIKPMEFPDKVRRELENEGFYVGLVSTRRIWRVYEDAVRRGFIYDYLGVVVGFGYSEEEE
ncbi:hypothetical protein [Vulcanisaeta thermophila]|uniref:hypothetical protein n=1 Tax=Vulcanisaeta thermophila TaxID=867917 RepID=UPI0008536507|nr:hypothetical protein [Vulcanisaeta thermophila]